jgi:poly(hydroxyalkanoate) depolymerase family esterase
MAIAGFSAQGQSDLLEIKSFGNNPGNLKMFLHEPPLAKQKKGLPLVVALHGCTQNAKVMAQESGWNDLADTYGFYVLYPQQRTINNPSGCFNWFQDEDATKDKGEVASVWEMIDFAKDSLDIDTTRIFVYGLSAGAALSVALMADYPSLFNMGAILAGGPFMPGKNPFQAMSAMENPKDLSPQELTGYVVTQNPTYKGNYPRMIIMQGTEDKVVNEKNAYLLIKQWAPLLAADSAPTRTVTQFDNKADITRKAYCNKAGTEQIIFYEVANLGHALMVAPSDTTITGGGRTGMFAIDKGFFSTYWIAKDMGLLGK